MGPRIQGRGGARGEKRSMIVPDVTFASWLVQAGVHLKVIGEMMGHSTPVVTERYAHLAPGTAGAKESALALLDGVAEMGRAEKVEVASAHKGDDRGDRPWFSVRLAVGGRQLPRSILASCSLIALLMCDATAFAAPIRHPTPAARRSHSR